MLFDHAEDMASVRETDEPFFVEAKIAAAKAACLAAAVKAGGTVTISSLRYDDTQVARLADVTLPDSVLPRLRGGNPKAFHSWEG